MIAYIGKPRYVSMYTILKPLDKYPRLEKYADKLAEFLGEKCKVNSLLEKLFTRIMYVKVHKHDSWNADHTIALIAKPVIEQLKNDNVGHFFVADDDVPTKLRTGATWYQETEAQGIAKHRYVLNEILWALGTIVDDRDFTCDPYKESDTKALADRQRKGLELFGKYFKNLWD